MQDDIAAIAAKLTKAQLASGYSQAAYWAVEHGPALIARVEALERQIATYEAAMLDTDWITDNISNSMEGGWRSKDGAAAVVDGFESVIADAKNESALATKEQPAPPQMIKES